MKKIYIVMALRREMKIRAGEEVQELDMQWADGMIGVMAVFEDGESAMKYVGDSGIDILEATVVETKKIN
jgi:hypothetical protein